MTDTTPATTARERQRIGKALERAFAADPIDRMLPDYRALTADDVLRFDVHWLGQGSQPGRIGPLFDTDRMNVRPLRILRGFLQRLDAGYGRPQRVNASQETASHVKRPGHGFVTVVTAGGGILDGTGTMGGFAWNDALRRKDGTLKATVQDRICAAWGLTSNGPAFWNGPSGPFAWTRPDGRFVLANTDGWGCPVLLDAVWHSNEEASDHTEEGKNQ